MAIIATNCRVELILLRGIWRLGPSSLRTNLITALSIANSRARPPVNICHERRIRWRYGVEVQRSTSSRHAERWIAGAGAMDTVSMGDIIHIFQYHDP